MTGPEIDDLLAFADRVLAQHGMRVEADAAPWLEAERALLDSVRLRQEGCWMMDGGDA
jgi:hypothetical protein